MKPPRRNFRREIKKEIHLNNPIAFEHARIAEVQHKISAGTIISKLKVVAIASAKVARLIGARWLLDKDQLIKQGFTSVELDFEMKNVRVRHAIDKISSIETNSETAHKFRVFRKGDDKKKAKRLMVSFVVQHSGSPFEVLEHLLKVGEGEGVCTLQPLQSEMFDTRPAEPKKRTRQKELPLAPAKKAAKKANGGSVASKQDVDRKSSAKRERKKKNVPDPFMDEQAVVSASEEVIN